jgi:hypothetical protein
VIGDTVRYHDADVVQEAFDLGACSGLIIMKRFDWYVPLVLDESDELPDSIPRLRSCLMHVYPVD